MARTLGIVGAGLLMVAVSWCCTTLPNPRAQFAGWFGLVLFGPALVAWLAQLARKDPSVVLDGEGIHEHRAGFGTIPWADIVSLRIGTLKPTRFLCVEVRDPKLFLSRLPLHRRLLARANRALGFPLAGLEPGLDEAWLHLQTVHPEKIVAWGVSGRRGRTPGAGRARAGLP